MTTCVVEQRRNCTTAAEAIVDHDAVCTIDVLQPDERRQCWRLHVVLDADAIPPMIAREIGAAGLYTPVARPQGAYFEVVAAGRSR